MDSHGADLAGGPLTPAVTVIAVLLAVLLGAGHAALPGHGKTVLAAYLARRAGRPRDALTVATSTGTGSPRSASGAPPSGCCSCWPTEWGWPPP